MTRHATARRVWAACSDLALAHKPITIRKVQAMVGLRSRSTVSHHLETLELAGYIVKPHGEHVTYGDWVVQIPLITMRKKED